MSVSRFPFSQGFFGQIDVQNRAGRARRDLEARIARLEQMAGETLCTASYLAHYYDRS